MQTDPDYAGLDEADRTVLLNWAARASDVHAVVDLSLRPWNVSGVRAVVGIFAMQQDRASWLLVRAQREWVLARCRDGFVSDATDSLGRLLAMIEARCPAR